MTRSAESTAVRHSAVLSPATQPGGLGLTVITGASSGLGREFARLLTAEGVPLLVSGRDEGALRQTGADAIAADLGPGGTAASARAIAAAAARAGGARTLIASAGLGWAGPVEQTPLDTVEALVAVNVLAPLLLTRLLLPGMLAAGDGRIVLVGSVAGAVGVRGEAVYSASKAALVGFADAVRAEVAGRGVTVTLALPGPVDTAFFRRRGAPYARRRPAPQPPAQVAAAILAAARAGRCEVFLPWWLEIASRLRGVAPGSYRRIARRWG